MNLLPIKVQLTLRNPRKRSATLTLEMDLYDRPITLRWLEKLRENLEAQLHLTKNFCFLAWPSTHRDIPFICQELSRQINTINSFSNEGGWPEPYFINETYTPEAVLKEGQLNQELMNQLHHHFATLHGPIWNVSQFLSNATQRVRFAIYRLNFLCHELEALVEHQQMAAIFGSEKLSPSIILNFIGAPKSDLLEEDYDLFEYRRYFGGVHLHYCQVGKRWDEAFEDKDQLAQGEAISGLRLLSGEFNVHWGEHPPIEFELKLKEIHEWLISKGQNPQDKKLSLGFIYVGEFNRQKNFGDLPLKKIHDLIGEHADIDQISIIYPEKTVSCSFPYSDTDENFDELQLEAIKKDDRRDLIKKLFALG